MMMEFLLDIPLPPSWDIEDFLGGPKILKRFGKARTKLAAGPLAWPLGGIVLYFAVNAGIWEKVSLD
jgi:hypothetical protein